MFVVLLAALLRFCLHLREPRGPCLFLSRREVQEYRKKFQRCLLKFSLGCDMCPPHLHPPGQSVSFGQSVEAAMYNPFAGERGEE